MTDPAFTVSTANPPSGAAALEISKVELIFRNGKTASMQLQIPDYWEAIAFQTSGLIFRRVNENTFEEVVGGFVRQPIKVDSTDSLQGILGPK